MASPTTDAPETTKTDQTDKSVREVAREMMEKRLRELEPSVREFEALKADVDALHGRANGVTPAPASRPAEKISGESTGDGETQARRGRPRGGGQRMEQFLAAVSEKPGIKIPEIAKAMEISPNYLYRLRTQAEEEGKIRREESTGALHPVS